MRINKIRNGCGKKFFNKNYRKYVNCTCGDFGCFFCPECVKSQKSAQTHTHRLMKEVACGDSSRLSKQGSEKSLHPEADDFFCNNCKDECDCHLFVGGSGKACPDCEKPQQSVEDKK